MENKYKPDQWAYQGRADSEHHMILGANNTVVAVAYRREDARLITAAPRLLEALEDYLAAHDKAATEGKLSLGIDAGFDLHLMYEARTLVKEITEGVI